MILKRSSLGAALCVLVLTAATSNAADKSEMYIIELQVLVAKGKKIVLESQNAVTGEDLVSAGGVQKMRVGDLEPDFDADNIWDGEFQPPENSGVELLTAPRVVTRAGATAEIRSGASAQYLALKDEGCYELKTMPVGSEPGIFMELTPFQGPLENEGEETVDLEVGLRVATIQEREPVPGLRFDVGRPVISSQEVSTRYRYSLNRWNVIVGHLSKDQQETERETLFILVRVKRPPS